MGGHLRPAPGAGSGQRGAPRWRMHQRGWRRPAGAAAAAEWTLGRVCARAWPRLAAPVQRAAAVRLAIGRTEQRQVRGSVGRRCFKPGASVPQPGPQGSDPARISARRCPILVARGLPAAGGKGGARTRSSGARGRRRSSAEALAGSHRLPRNRSADLAACRRGSAPALPRKSALLSKIRPCASPRREARPSRRVPSGALSRVGSAGLQKKKYRLVAATSDARRERSLGGPASGGAGSAPKRRRGLRGSKRHPLATAVAQCGRCKRALLTTLGAAGGAARHARGRPPRPAPAACLARSSAAPPKRPSEQCQGTGRPPGGSLAPALSSGHALLDWVTNQQLLASASTAASGRTSHSLRANEPPPHNESRDHPRRILRQ